MTTVSLKQLKLGDTVQLFDGAYGTGTVVQVTKKYVKIFRPYATTSDFRTTYGVIPYIGFDICKYLIHYEAEFKLLYHPIGDFPWASMGRQ